MNVRLKILGIIHIVYGVFAGLAATAIFIYPGSLSVNIVAIVGISALLSTISILEIAGGIGMLYHKAWAHSLVKVLSIFALLNAPFGTATGIYTLRVLKQERAGRSLTG